jgi:hypothetical protein
VTFHCLVVFHCGDTKWYTILHSHWQGMRVLLASSLYQYLVLPVCYISITPVCVWVVSLSSFSFHFPKRLVISASFHVPTGHS